MSNSSRSICVASSVLLCSVAAHGQGADTTGTASTSQSVSATTAGVSASGASASGEAATDAQGFDYHDHHFEMSAFTGILFPSGGHSLLDTAASHRPYNDMSLYMLGGRLGYFPVRWVGLELEYMHARGAVKAPRSSPRADFNAYRVQLIGQLALWPVTPFVVVGGGALQALSERLGADTDPAFHFGVGVKAPLGRAVAMRLDVRENLHDRINARFSEIAFSEEVQLSLTFSLDAPAEGARAPQPDMDHDTVPDALDSCPTVPALTRTGCPLDTDGDGIWDQDDHCPREKGVAPTGCPDLDADADGVPLPCDLCPDEKGVAPDGCPARDTDGDGILDRDDKCPNEPETKNGFQDQDGCPDEVPAEVQAFNGVIPGIEFDVGRATVRQTSHGVLTQALDVLKKHTSVRVRVVGHTSSEGTAQFNQKLSEERAQAVKNWLTERGVSAERIETRGAGPNEPLSENTTRAGRMKNRRIEFKLLDGK